MKERWEDMPGYEDRFMVSDHGRVWSKFSNRTLTQSTTKSGYKVISTRIGGRKGRCVVFRVHRLVAELFLPEPHKDLFTWAEGTVYKQVIVNHKDCDKSNNYFENLEWCTQSDNMLHSYENGLSNAVKGADSHISKLKQTDIIFIRENYRPHCRVYGGRALARRFGVAHSTIQAVLNEVTWTA